EVGKVIAHERRLRQGNPPSVENRAQSGELPSLRVLEQVIDLQLLCTQANAVGHAAGHDRYHEPGLPKQKDTESVLDVVPLELDSGPTDVSEENAPVGQDAVDIEAYESDAASERPI